MEVVIQALNNQDHHHPKDNKVKIKHKVIHPKDNKAKINHKEIHHKEHKEINQMEQSQQDKE